MWPFRKVKHYDKPDSSKFKEQDKDLLTTEQLKKDDQEFKKEAGFLSNLLKRFKKFL